MLNPSKDNILKALKCICLGEHTECSTCAYSEEGDICHRGNLGQDVITFITDLTVELDAMRGAANSYKTYSEELAELLHDTRTELTRVQEENEQLKKAKYIFSTVDYCSDDLARALEENAELKEKVEDLETMIFAFVWNRGVAPVGKHLGKSEEEIADKVLETIREGEKMICYPVMRKRMQEAKARLEAKEGEGDGEE